MPPKQLIDDSGYEDDTQYFEYSSDSEQIPSVKLYTSLVLIPHVKINTSSLVENAFGKIEVSNHQAFGISTAHAVKFSSAVGHGDIRFESVFPSPVIVADCSDQIVAVACEDYTVSVFKHSGILLFSPLLVDARPANVFCRSHSVLVITSEASVSVWDTFDKRKIVTNSSLANLFDTVSVKLLSGYLNNDNIPIIVLSTGRNYCYNENLGCWVLLQDNAFNSTNSHNTVAAGTSADIDNRPLAKLAEITPTVQAAVTASIMHSSTTPSASSDALQRGVSLKYCQMQEASAREIKSCMEYKRWLLSLVSELTFSALEAPLKHVLDDLRGPGHVLGLSKRDLLREALAIVDQ